jgi:aryl-alcohol dehydrogenase-like predicted oxidoreductase
VRLSERAVSIINEIAKIADECSVTKTQVCVNWVRQQQPKAQMIPLLGARTAVQLRDNLDSLKWTLSEDHLKRLDEVSKIQYGFPRNFLEGGAREYIFGATFDKIDNHRGNPV